MIAQTALPLLALLAPLHRICLLQPAEPEQGAEHPGWGDASAPATGQARPAAARPGLLIPLLRQLLQCRPVSGYLAAKGPQSHSHSWARAWIWPESAGGRRRPALPAASPRQALHQSRACRAKCSSSRGLPGGAGACQQAGASAEIQEAQEFGTLVIGRDLPRLPRQSSRTTSCARSRPVTEGMRDHCGMGPPHHRQDQGQGSPAVRLHCCSVR